MVKKWRVLVAEDEPVILNGICNFISRSTVGCEVVARACDGEEAIREMLDLEPDIIVSDIQMPKATGLDMIRKARENNLSVQFIFISGYQEFEYVREALKYNAVDYLLKPISMEDLEDTLLKAIRKMSEDTLVKIMNEEKNPVQKFFEKIHHGKEFAEMESYERFQELRLDIRDDYFFQGLSFQIDTIQPETAGFGQIELIKFVLYDKVQQYLEKRRKGFLASKGEAGCYFIIYAQKKENLEEICAEVLELRGQIEAEYEMRLFVGVGEWVRGMKGLTHAYKTVCFAQELHYFEESKEVIYYSHIHKRYETSFEDYNRAVNILKETLVLHKEQYGDCLDNVFRIIFNLHYGNRTAAENRMQILLEEMTSIVFSYNLITEEERQEKETYSKRISMSDTFRDACKECRVCLDDYYKKSISIMTNKETAEVIKIKKYIKEHYAEDISLGYLADMVGMNTSYLSALFKRNTDRNYLEYLTDIRMEEAHKLLMGTDMMTYQIAEAVGYRTVRRFVESFKKRFGMSPMEYKKEHM